MFGNIVSILKASQINNELQLLGADIDTISKVNSNINYNIEETEEENDSGIVIAMMSSFILFFAVYFYGYSVSSSISSEKTSRVMETLITSTTPSSIVIGKTIAMGLFGLLQLIGLILVSYISYKVFIPEGFEMIDELLKNTNFSLSAVIVVLIYFVLGYTVFAFLNAVTGATVSKAEDIQSANMPISLIALVSFYLSYFTAMTPYSGLRKFASIFPFSSPFSMPVRIIEGSVAMPEILLSIAVLLLTAVVLAVISIKIYSLAVLHYGDRLKFSDLLKMFKSK